MYTSSIGGMGGMGGMSGMDSGSGLLSFMDSWPSWASTLAIILAVLLLGFIAGKILGRLYASIRYPDPNKPQTFSAKQKIVFLVTIMVVIGMMYSALKPETPVMDDMMGMEGNPSSQVGGVSNSNKGGGTVRRSGNGAIAIRMN